MIRRKRLKSLLATLRVAGLLLPGGRGSAVPAAPGAPAKTLSADVDDDVVEAFVRDGNVAAHLALDGGAKPRILIGFPAGDSGVAVWLTAAQDVSWTLHRPPHTAVFADARNRPLYGITAEITTHTSALRFDVALLSSVRVLRTFAVDRQAAALPFHERLFVAPEVEGNRIVWQRERLDGQLGYFLAIDVTEGRLTADLEVVPVDGRISLRVTGASGEPPLAPLAADRFVRDARQIEYSAGGGSVTYLAFEEKLLGGSWRYATYFGRDTLLSIALLQEVLTSEAMEVGLRSTLVRLSASGEVAHEESIGEFAVIDHLLKTGIASAQPVFDYVMVDADLLLAPVAAAWLLDDARGSARAREFLGEADDGCRLGEHLLRNFRRVLDLASPLANAATPNVGHLLGPKAPLRVSQWRDSQTGLGRAGWYAYDVNAVLVPAALEAIARFAGSGLLAPFVGDAATALQTEARRLEQGWREVVPGWFEVAVPLADACDAVRAYAAHVGVAAGPALAALEHADDMVRFNALSLERDGTPVPVLHSDEGAALMWDAPSAQEVGRIVDRLLRPFPAGLCTDVGMVIANPAFAAPDEWPVFERHLYHGALVWPWQEAALATGIMRQARRQDLPVALRARLEQALRMLREGWRGVPASLRARELYSWQPDGDRYRTEPYRDLEGANSLQLWSAAFLGLKDG
ncbi:MAG: hypothetical protein ACRYHA_04890 [Janthinobacterium lividum]